MIDEKKLNESTLGKNLELANDKIYGNVATSVVGNSVVPAILGVLGITAGALTGLLTAVGTGVTAYIIAKNGQKIREKVDNLLKTIGDKINKRKSEKLEKQLNKIILDFENRLGHKLNDSQIIYLRAQLIEKNELTKDKDIQLILSELKNLGVNTDKMVNKLENSLNIELENELKESLSDENLFSVIKNLDEEKDNVNEDLFNETYSDEELDDLIGKVFNQQKIERIYRRRKYDDKRLFAKTVCTICGREKKVFLSNLVNDPEKYGSCICSDTNIEAKIDNATELYKGTKKLSTNTSGYTGVSFVKTYRGKPYHKWRAYIEVDGVRTYLGDFSAKAKAIKARKEAAEKGVKWYKENRNKLMRNVRRKTKKFKNSKYRDTDRKKTINITDKK